MHFGIDCVISIRSLCFAKYKKDSSLIHAIQHTSLCSLSKHYPEGGSCLTFKCYAICYIVHLLLTIQSATHSTGDLSTFETSANIMALIEALSTTSVVYSDGFLERSSCCDYCSLVQHNPDHTNCDSHLVMNDRDL